jgi:hypothetical protein
MHRRKKRHRCGPRDSNPHCTSRGPSFMPEVSEDVEFSFDKTFDLDDDLERRQRIATVGLRKEAEQDEEPDEPS